MTLYRTGLLFKSLVLCAAALAAASAVLPSSARNVSAIETAQARQRAETKSPVPLLTKDDINLIKVYEVHLDTDPPPRIDIPKKVLEKFLTDYKSDDRVPRGKAQQKAWLQKDGHEQLELIFKVQARKYYGKATVKSRIDSLRKWGPLHRRYVLGYFYDHFGKGDIKGLALHPIARRSLDQIEFTNFYILSRTIINGERLINRDDPEESLLLQWGLPASEAKFASPKTKKDGWRPYFKSTKDKRYQEMVEWIKSLHRFNQNSDYGIQYSLPGTKKAPATKSTDKDK